MAMISVVMLLTAIIFLYFVIRNINRNTILFEQAAMWMILGIILVVCAVFPAIPDWFGHLLGFQLTSNFILFLAVIVLIVLLFLQTIQLSKQKDEVRNLIQEVSILKKELLDYEKNNE